MALYLIGDVQGCDAALQHLLDTVAFSPSRDTAYLLGDLVNRGPNSLGVLRRLMGYGEAARCLLGNHDLHLLAVAHGVRRPKRQDTLDAILQSSERDGLLHWLRQQRLAMHLTLKQQGILMVHAGVLPQWTATQTIALAQEVESVLQSHDAADFFHVMYGDTPAAWSDDLTGDERLRVVVNALTRLRFCTEQGVMEFAHKGDAKEAPAGHMPWFDVPGRKTADTTVAFGHWSTLRTMEREDVWALDSGCVWGGALSAMCIHPDSAGQAAYAERIQVRCEPMQTPGTAAAVTPP